MNTDDQREVIAFLSRGESYGLAERVERRETHASIVFLAGERAYKLKRAVRYPYLDYSTREKRRAMCETELQVNKRAAPELYLEVQPIVRSNGTLRLGGESRGDLLDWVIVMRRFDERDLFEHLRREGRLDERMMRELGDIIAQFHGNAEVRNDFGGAAAMARVVEENSVILRRMADRPFATERIERWIALAAGACKRVSALLDARRAHGFVRRCHGDLHLNNICLFKEHPTLFDAIEFNDDFACIDVLYDLAFLIMDVDRHGLRKFANLVLNRYLERTGDYAAVAALPLFLSARAAVRAHIAVTTAERSPAETKILRASAVALLDRAIGYLEPSPVRAIAIGGISGTGKSALARELAALLGRAPGALVLRSDIIRKRTLGAAETERLPASAYTPEMHARVYAAMRDAAEALLLGGHSIIADAVHGRAEERQGIEAVARRAGANFQGLWLRAPHDILEQRLAARTGDASDATVEIMEAQLKTISAPENWRTLETSTAVEDVLASAKHELDM